MNLHALRSRGVRWQACAAAALLGAIVVPSGPARATFDAAPAAVDTVDDVAASLKRDRVFVDPDAELALTSSDADRLRDRIGDAGTAIYVAVLPQSVADAAGGDPETVARDVIDAVGLRGTYAVVVGRSFRAGSNALPSGVAQDAATTAIGEHRDEGTAAVLLDFVDRVESAAAGGSGSRPGGSSSGEATPAGGASTSTSNDSEGGGIGLGTVLLVGAGGGLGVWAWRRSRRAKAEAAERARADEADRQMLRAELSVLADDVLRLEHDVLLHPAAQEDYDAAVHRFRAAEAALGYADEPVDLVRVRRVLDEGTYSMARAKAIAAGRTPPEPPEELRRPGSHGEPAIDLDDQRRPTYVGYGGPFQSGWYGGGMGGMGGGGLFSGLLLGSMLGGFGPFGFGGGWGGTTVINEGDTYVGGDGGFGGGGFGGGDFGGGGFGGGDFGGGDFGGGDF